VATAWASESIAITIERMRLLVCGIDDSVPLGQTGARAAAAE